MSICMFLLMIDPILNVDAHAFLHLILGIIPINNQYGMHESVFGAGGGVRSKYALKNGTHRLLAP